MTQISRSLPEQLKALEHIQELDLKIDQLQKNKNALPETLRAMDQSITKVKTAVTGKNNAIAEIEKTQKQTRAAQDLNRDRLGRSSSRLEGVQNSQEFQAANKEVEQLKKLTQTLEEQSKKSETEIDAIRKEMSELETQMTQLQTERESQATVLNTQSSQLEGEVKTLMGARSEHTSQVDRQLLSQYDRVRQARGGLGFVPAIAGRCKGCNMMVPPQLFNEIRKCNAIHACPSCHRILFVPAN